MAAENIYFDKEERLETSKGVNLPHWHQNNKAYFITFRLDDSLPMSRAAELTGIKRSFEQHNPKPWDAATRLKYHKLIGRVEECLLDAGYGECCLRNDRCRRIVADAINRLNRDVYDIVAYVIMPNHIHLLTVISERGNAQEMMRLIKGISSREINGFINRSGKLWHADYFDRIVRSEDHFKHCLNYIVNNPKNLREGEYSLYVKGMDNLWSKGFSPCTQ